MIVDIKWRLLQEDDEDMINLEFFYEDGGEKFHIFRHPIYEKRGWHSDINGFLEKSNLSPEDFWENIILKFYTEMVEEAKKILVKEML